jgi:hypothetical protein
MPRLPRTLRLALAWLLVFVLPLQGMSLAIAAARGPLHTHAQAPTSTAPLIDLRRAFAAPTVTPSSSPVATSEWAHLAGHLQGERHHHAAGDTTVMRDPADPAAGQDDLPQALAMPFIALVSAETGWCAVADVSETPAAPAWTPTMRSPAPLERPPRLS